MCKNILKIAAENHADSSTKIIRTVCCSRNCWYQDILLGLYIGQPVHHERAEAAVLCSRPDQCVMLTGGRIHCYSRLAKMFKANELQQ